MKTIKPIILGIIMLASIQAFSQNEDDQKIMSDAQNAKKALLKTDPGLQKFFDSSAGYVIFPNVGKGGFIIGAALGNGVLYETQMAVGMANMKKVSVGLQAGGQAVIEVLFFENDNVLAEFKGGEFELSAEISAVALKSGVSKNAKYKEGIAVFTLPKAGLMADVSVGGQKFTYKGF